MSKAELIDEMLSYYWIVNELSKTVGEGTEGPETDADPNHSLQELRDHSDAPRESEPEGPREDEARESAKESPVNRSAGELVADAITEEDRLEEIVRSLQRLQEGVDRIDESSPASDGDSSDDGPSELDGEEIAEAFLALQEHVEALQTRQDAAQRQIRQIVSRLERRQERIAKQAADDDDLEDVTTVQEAIVDELTDLDDRLDATIEHYRTLESSKERLEDRIDGEFDDLEQILTHLLETMSRFDTRLEDEIGSVKADTKMLKYQVEKHHHLGELKREANLQGIEKADCSNCGVTCRLGLLETPFCPDCGEQFAGIEPTWVPFKNATLRNGGPLKR
jgi:hypothetical protein